MRPSVSPRGFDLCVEPTASDRYGLRLLETTQDGGGDASGIARLSSLAVLRVRQHVLEALRQSRLPNSTLSPSRRRPIHLSESAGVRLALLMLATSLLRKPERVETVAGGVQGMTTEEAYYWYAKCVAEDGRRAQRALRLLLAEE